MALLAVAGGVEVQHPQPLVVDDVHRGFTASRQPFAACVKSGTGSTGTSPMTGRFLAPSETASAELVCAPCPLRLSLSCPLRRAPGADRSSPGAAFGTARRRVQAYGCTPSVLARTPRCKTDISVG
eukprot:scaffold64226_cov32-Tisochrysis_lutea.AAC.1